MLFNKKMQDEIGSNQTINFPERRTNVMEPSNVNNLMHRKPANMPNRSVIDGWLKITGNLESDGEIQVEGQVCGDIRCSRLIVGRDSSIAGNVMADEVVVRGKIKGVIRANRVTLQETAIIDSEIYHKALSIEEGACFEGRSCRRDDPMAVAADDTPAQTSELRALAAEMKAAYPEMEPAPVSAAA